MKLENLSFVITDDCNFECVYCRQQKENSYLKRPIIENAIDFFYPYLKEECSFFFYGGEPLMGFDMIQHAVSTLEEKNSDGKKKHTYSVTTNGSLLTDDMLDFFNRHRFIMLLSYDGISQDDTRYSGSKGPTLELIRQMLAKQAEGEYRDIAFSTNSVFAPASVHLLSRSVREIVETGLTGFKYGFALDEPWDDAALLTLEKELEKVAGFLVSHYKENKSIPVNNFKPSVDEPGNDNVFSCDGGINRMAIAPDDYVWGCTLLQGYLKDCKESDDFHRYSFGRLDEFIRDYETIYPRVRENYAVLKQACFYTGEQPCFLCDDLHTCNICPLSVAPAVDTIGQMPTWVCSHMKIQREVRQKFLAEIEA